MISIDTKHVTPIMNFVNVSDLASVWKSFKDFLCLFSVISSIQPQPFVLASLHKSNTNLSFIVLSPLLPPKSPNMDVVTIDTFLNVDNKIVDTETDHIHEQSYQNQKK